MIDVSRYNLLSICDLRLLAAVVLCIIGLGGLAGCSMDKETSNKIDEAERIAQNDPERAIEIMASVERNKLDDEEDFARYALVYSEALYYGQRYIDSDTLTRPMIHFYLTSDNHAERARAFYQHALLLNHMGEYPEAMLSLITAEESLAKSPNERLAGLVCRTKGYIYSSDCLFENSYNEHKRSIEHFAAAKLDEHYAFALYDMADALDNLHRYEEAEKLYLQALEYGVEHNNKHLMCGSLHGLCDIYICMDEFEKCGATLDLFEKYDCLVYYISNYYCLRAIVEANRGEYDAANEFVATAASFDDADETNIEFTRYAVNRLRGDFKEALLWHEQSKLRQDSLMLQVLKQSVLNVQVDLLQNGVEKERSEAELKAQRNTIVFIALGVILALIIAYLRYTRTTYKRNVASYLQTIKELGGSADNLRSEVYDLYRDRFADFNRMCETYYEHGNTPREATKLFEEVKITIDAIKSDEQRIKDLERIVNLQHNGIMEHLRKECPKLTERELKVILYSYAGFSARAITIFMDSDLAALSRLKYKIKTKLHEAEFSKAREVLNSILGR